MPAKMWSNRNSHSLIQVGMQNGTPALEDSLQFLTKLNIFLPYDLANILLSIYVLKGTETYVNRKSCILTFIADLFIVAKAWKQPRCSSVGKWINKLRYIQIMEFYSALKRNELSSCEKTWRQLKCILLSERSRAI